MNKKRTYTLVALLIAIVALGIGYAAVTSLLDITGNATALESDGVQLEFTGTPTNSGTQPGNGASIVSGNPQRAVCTVVLKTAGETATCTYTVTNNTTDTSLSATNLAATVYEDSSYNTAWNNTSSSDYFTITSAVGAATLANGASTTATVTVTLKKENTTDATMPETFYVKIVGETDQS